MTTTTAPAVNVSAAPAPAPTRLHPDLAFAAVKRTVEPQPDRLTVQEWAAMEKYIRILLSAYLGVPTLELNCRTYGVRYVAH